jgi:hypothetical protein
MFTKVLWVVSGDPTILLRRVKTLGVGAIAVRTDNAWLAGSISQFHVAGVKVYGWRWPGVRSSNDPPNYYAPDQADFVVRTLIPAGLDGYIADIESDGALHPARDWNSRALGPLADGFAKAISNAGKKQKADFIFGLTSGYDFPTAFPQIPWDAFLAYCGAVYPQIYWRGDGGVPVAGGTPQSAYTRTLTSWNTLALGAIPIVPIIGQISSITAQSISDFATIMNANKMTEVHFYCDEPGIDNTVYSAITSL